MSHFVEHYCTVTRDPTRSSQKIFYEKEWSIVNSPSQRELVSDCLVYNPVLFFSFICKPKSFGPPLTYDYISCGTKWRDRWHVRDEWIIFGLVIYLPTYLRHGTDPAYSASLRCHHHHQQQLYYYRTASATALRASLHVPIMHFPILSSVYFYQCYR